MDQFPSGLLWLMATLAIMALAMLADFIREFYTEGNMPLNLGSLISFDSSKIDKVALRKWLVSGAQLLEPAVITPGNIDKMLFDNIDWLAANLIDQISKEGGTLIVGDHGEVGSSSDGEVSQADLNEYMGRFASAPEESKAILRRNPRLVKRLEKFSQADQEKIVGNPLLLLALQTLLPILFLFLLKKFSS
ncbi:MAG: hypothetical protein JNJ77_19985 [Planctomycetia bacterium]|nr:hypothetical protein [Planctomycetia bacterium]